MSETKLNGSAHKLASPIRLRFGHNGDTYPAPIQASEKIPIGMRNLTFQEIVESHDKLLRQGLDKYASRAESYENNMHNAMLALWNTIVNGASYNDFRARFFKEMKRAVRNDNYGMQQFEKRALRLDNKNNNWHDAIPDRKASLNLGLMAHQQGRRVNYRIVERVDPRIARNASRRRSRERKRGLLARNAEREEELKWERIEAANNFRQLMLGHMDLIGKAAVEKPFLMTPSAVIEILSKEARICAATRRVRLLPKDIRLIRLQMGKIIPVDADKVEMFVPKPLKFEEYKKVKALISTISDYYRHSWSGKLLEYLNALNLLITMDEEIPKEIAVDLKRVVKRLEKRKNDDSNRFGMHRFESEFDYDDYN